VIGRALLELPPDPLLSRCPGSPSLAVSGGRSARESALAGWLARRRDKATAGILSPTYATPLDAIPRWRDYPTKRDADAASWTQRLGEVAAWQPAA
jgi:hypothetical protein